MADEVGEFLSASPSEVADVSEAVRALLKKLCPSAEEELKRGWKTVSYRRAKAFCAIAPHAKWVNLQFFDGAGLSDPEEMLEGSGKSMRHVKLTSKKDVTRKKQGGLILAAEKRASE